MTTLEESGAAFETTIEDGVDAPARVVLSSVEVEIAEEIAGVDGDICVVKREKGLSATPEVS